MTTLPNELVQKVSALTHLSWRDLLIMSRFSKSWHEYVYCPQVDNTYWKQAFISYFPNATLNIENERYAQAFKRCYRQAQADFRRNIVDLYSASDALKSDAIFVLSLMEAHCDAYELACEDIGNNIDFIELSIISSDAQRADACRAYSRSLTAAREASLRNQYIVGEVIAESDEEDRAFRLSC